MPVMLMIAFGRNLAVESEAGTWTADSCFQLLKFFSVLTETSITLFLNLKWFEMRAEGTFDISKQTMRHVNAKSEPSPAHIYPAQQPSRLEITRKHSVS